MGSVGLLSVKGAAMWLYLPTSCRSVPGEEVSTEASDSLYRTLALSATWKTKSRPAASWSRTWKQVGWTTRLFGQTYEPSTAQRGAESWISSLAATRVSPSPTPGSVSETPTPATSGLTCDESWARFSRSDASSRTSELICDSDSVRSPETFKAWATALRRSCLQRKKSALLTGANDSSSWPTARASYNENRNTQPAPSHGVTHGKTLAGEAVRVTRNWQTPNAAAEAPNLGSNIRNGPKPLLAQAEQTTRRMWQTPAVFQGKYRRQVHQTKRAEELLPAQAQRTTERLTAWATPTSRDWKDGSEPSAGVSTNSLLGRQAPMTMRDGLASLLPDDWTSSRLRLNPKFVEWLMGWEENSADIDTSSTPQEASDYLIGRLKKRTATGSEGAGSLALTGSTSSVTASSPSRRPTP